MDTTSLDALLLEGRKPINGYGTDELLPIFLEDGTPYGEAPKKFSHKVGLRHKVVYCFLMDAEANLLLQVRRDGRLDVAVGGHLNVDDTDPLSAIQREMKEEIGLELSEEALCYLGWHNRFSPITAAKPDNLNVEIRELFLAQLPARKVDELSNIFEKRLCADEVSELKWFSVRDVVDLCAKGLAADGLIGSLPHFLLEFTKFADALQPVGELGLRSNPESGFE